MARRLSPVYYRVKTAQSLRVPRAFYSSQVGLGTQDRAAVTAGSEAVWVKPLFT